jgi:hypothetical protein
LSQPNAEYPFNDENHQTEQRKHRQIGRDEQENAFHEPFLWGIQPQYGDLVQP